MEEVQPVLENINKHERDDFLTFDEPTHVYSHTIRTDLRFISVTTFIHKNFNDFDPSVAAEKMMNGRKWNESHEMWGKTSAEIQEIWKSRGVVASNLGTILHNNIESFLNNPHLPKDYTHAMLLETYSPKVEDVAVEWTYFMQYVRDCPHKIPYRTEWRIFDIDLQLAGSIDMVYKNDDGSLSIYDWKRSKEIKRENKYEKSKTLGLPDCNFYHYSLQLNTYKFMLERSYGVKVKELVLVILHPDKTNYETVVCADLQEVVGKLMEERLKNLLK